MRKSSLSALVPFAVSNFYGCINVHALARHFVVKLNGYARLEFWRFCRKDLSGCYAIKWFFLLFVACSLSCGTVKPYKEPGKPVFYSNKKNEQSSARGD